MLFIKQRNKEAEKAALEEMFEEDGTMVAAQVAQDHVSEELAQAMSCKSFNFFYYTSICFVGQKFR